MKKQYDSNLVVEKISKKGMTFYDVTKAPFSLHGVWYEDGKIYRVPKDVAARVSEGIVVKSVQTAGGRVRFRTNSSSVAVKATLHTSEDVSIMPISSSKGFDLYVDGVFYRGFKISPTQGDGDYEAKIMLDGAREREITIHMPLYAGLSELYVGLDEGAELTEAKPYKISPPVVFYGSSITNGASSSRPGMTYEAILSRALDMDHHNLGFGGTARGERPMAEYIASLDMSAFVLDYDHNAPTVEHLENTHEAMFKTVREAHPSLPIIMVSRPQYGPESNRDERFEVIKATYDNAIAKGDENVYLLRGSEFFDGLDADFTVDGIHPTDLGFYRMAKALAPVLEKALKKALEDQEGEALVRIDEFFEKQPTPKFVETLNAPMHESAPDNFSRVTLSDGEVSVVGLYINEKYPECDVLDTAYDDFTKFLKVTSTLGDRIPLNIRRSAMLPSDTYEITVKDLEVIIEASDSEAARRAIFYLEEEMIKREGAILAKGSVRRTAKIKNRITRGFFSPTNRAPKWGDELLDEIDYYPEEYLNRLAHNGTNGLWIYTSFGQLVKSPYMPERGKDSEKRMKKLSDVVAKCKKYGVKVYVFAIEPMGLLPEERSAHEDMLGADAPMTPNTRRPLCPRIDKTREHIIYCLETIFGTIPDLAGYIDITAGERPTTCASVGHFAKCPRCSRFSRGENLAYSVDVIKEGLRRAGTGAEFISWTYGHRYWDDNDIIEYIEKAPSDVMFMQNFEDRGTDVQLGRERVAWDYWLSYPGPSDMFKISAKRAKELGKVSYAKMQVCSSHEMATVPYIPAPGILFDKYKAAIELGVEGIMECWYFGNYPSIMNRASTELSYLENFDDKAGFLRSLAARIYGESLADSVAAAWTAFEEGYRCYPTNIMFSYYGPMHDGVVWDLFPIPKNRALPRSWLLLDPPDGDRIGECLFKGHTLDEAIILADQMDDAWKRGLAALPFGCDDEPTLCARAIGTLINSGKNILNFYKKREELGEGVGDPYKILFEMESIVRAEIENSKIMTELCERDTRLGYHSEVEGFKFFPEKLSSRINKLKALFNGDFKTIRERLDDGKAPLGYYYAEGECAYALGNCSECAEVVKLDGERSFSAYLKDEKVILNIKCKPSDSFSACFEFSLFHPECMIVYSGSGGGSVHTEVVSERGEGLTLGGNVLSHQSVFGDEDIENQLKPYSVTSSASEEFTEHTLEACIPLDRWNRRTAIKLALRIGGVSWKSSKSPVRTLGKSDVSPCDFGFLVPKM